MAEACHQGLFVQLRGELAAQGLTVLVSDADLAEARRVLKEVVIPDRDQMLKALSASGPADLVDYAAEMERNSISYYRSLAEHLSEKGAVLVISRHLRRRICATRDPCSRRGATDGCHERFPRSTQVHRRTRTRP
jgi:hypothetical protein